MGRTLDVEREAIRNIAFLHPLRVCLLDLQPGEP
jgi:hypothetical protein